MTLLLIYLSVALALSALCSLLEAGLLSVAPSHVNVMVQNGSRAGRRLAEMKRDVDKPLAAILTLNTFAHTIGAAGVGAEAADIFGDAWVGVISFFVTLLILIFSEIIPKTIGAVYAKPLAPFTANTTHILINILKPIVWLCKRVSTLFTPRNTTPNFSRDEVRSIANIALEHGAIDEDESQLIHNLIALRDRSVESVTTPRTVVATLPADQTTRETLRRALPQFSRFPVVETSLDDTIGFVHRSDLTSAVVNNKLDNPLRSLARPLRVIPENAPLNAALQNFLQNRQHMLLVVDEHGTATGIVTLEDILEELLGREIVDETDRNIDMQQLARKLNPNPAN